MSESKRAFSLRIIAGYLLFSTHAEADAVVSCGLEAACAFSSPNGKEGATVVPVARSRYCAGPNSVAAVVLNSALNESGDLVLQVPSPIALLIGTRKIES